MLYKLPSLASDWPDSISEANMAINLQTIMSSPQIDSDIVQRHGISNEHIDDIFISMSNEKRRECFMFLRDRKQ